MARPCSWNNDLTSASSATSRRGLLLFDGIASLFFRGTWRRRIRSDIDERTVPRLPVIRAGRPAGSKILGKWHAGVNRYCAWRRVDDTSEGEGAMTTTRRTTMVVVAVAGISFLTACGSRVETPADRIAAKLPVAETRTVDAPPSAEGPGGLAGVGAQKSDKKVAKPTVAKTQKWVKIFSGPSDKDITPNA